MDLNNHNGPNSTQFAFADLNLKNISTPVHVTDEILLEKNLQIIDNIQKKTGAKVLLALKSFAQFSLFPLLRKYLKGTSSSSLFESRLAFEEFKGEVHIYSPAYIPEDFEELLKYADHFVFNSFQQWHFFREKIQSSSKKKSVGIRINPEHSEVTKQLYDTCAPNSRLGVRWVDFFTSCNSNHIDFDGLHFHTLCELYFSSLKRTWDKVEKQFEQIFPRLKWVNIGGGHHLTNSNYDIDSLCALLISIREKYKGIDVYIEPGEAITQNCGVLVSSVLDIIDSKNSELPIAILDISATVHVPDVLEVPYSPTIFTDGSWAEACEAKNGVNAKTENSKNKMYRYRLGGLSCLAGDTIGDYLFKSPLAIGQKIFLCDMSHYTMVKNSNFNGLRPPSIAIGNTQNHNVKIIKQFQYEDYKNRLS